MAGFNRDGIKKINANFRTMLRAVIALRITVRTFLNSQTLSLLTVPCSLFPVPLRVALYSEKLKLWNQFQDGYFLRV